MLSHPLTNFEIKKYENEPKFNGVYSRNDLSKIEDGAYKGVLSRGGCNTPPPFFWNLSVFRQNASVKFPDLMLSVNLEYFGIKNEMQNSVNIQSCRNQTVTGDGDF